MVGRDASERTIEWSSATTTLVRAMFQEVTTTTSEGARDLRTRFEDMLAMQCGVPDVRLRERRAQAEEAKGGDGDEETRTLSVAVPWRGGEAVLEASTSGDLVADGCLQILQAAAPIAVIVLEAGAVLDARAVLEAGAAHRRSPPSVPAFGEAVPNDLAPSRQPITTNTLSSFPASTRITIPKETTEDMDATWPLTQTAADATRPPCQLTGTGPEVEKLREEIDRAARTDFTVLIEGETGAGKEMVAHQIHEWSRRRGGPWVAVNCAALVDTLVEAELFGIEDRTATGVRGRRGKIELAHGGTLFLDEVAELTPAVQAKLLRVLQDFTVERVGGHQPRRVNARLIVATNRSLAPLVAERAFRSDLFYRVNLLRIYVPPLRERLTDLVELAESFLSRHQEFGITGISPAALEVMRTYAWPGNVRELFNVLADALTRAMGRGGREIGIGDLPESLSRPYRDVLQPSIERGDTMRAWAARYARLTLERCGNNKAKACQLLGISYHTLRSYLRRPLARPSSLASVSSLSPVSPLTDQPTPTQPTARGRPPAGTRKEGRD